MSLVRVVLLRILADAAALLAVIAALAMVAAQLGRFSDRADVLTHFTPLWLLLAVIAAVLAAPTPPGLLRRTTVVLAGVAVLLAATHILPEWLRDAGPPAQGPATLKVIQFNTWSGRNADPGGTADWIVAQDADVIVVEEALRRLQREIEARADYHKTCDPDDRCEVVIYSKAAPVSAGAPGDRTGAFFPTTRATFAAPGGPFTVIGAHFTWPIPAGLQQQQSLRLRAMAARYPADRLIIAGDFNSTPWSFSLRRQDKALGLIRRTQGLMTWPTTLFSRWKVPAPLPLLAIDQVYAGRDWKTVKVERGPALGSDHYPVVVTLALEPDAD